MAEMIRPDFFGFPRINYVAAANEIMSIQPLLNPGGLVHYLRERYVSFSVSDIMDDWKNYVKNKRPESVELMQSVRIDGLMEAWNGDSI